MKIDSIADKMFESLGFKKEFSVVEGEGRREVYVRYDPYSVIITPVFKISFIYQSEEVSMYEYYSETITIEKNIINAINIKIKELKW